MTPKIQAKLEAALAAKGERENLPPSKVEELLLAAITPIEDIPPAKPGRPRGSTNEPEPVQKQPKPRAKPGFKRGTRSLSEEHKRKIAAAWAARKDDPATIEKYKAGWVKRRARQESKDD